MILTILCSLALARIEINLTDKNFGMMWPRWTSSDLNSDYNLYRVLPLSALMFSVLEFVALGCPRPLLINFLRESWNSFSCWKQFQRVEFLKLPADAAEQTTPWNCLSSTNSCQPKYFETSSWNETFSSNADSGFPMSVENLHESNSGTLTISHHR